MNSCTWNYDGFTRGEPAWEERYNHQHAFVDPRYPVLYGDGSYCGRCHLWAHGRRHHELWRGVDGVLDMQQHGARSYVGSAHHWEDGNWSDERYSKLDWYAEKVAGGGDGAHERKEPIQEATSVEETKGNYDNGRSRGGGKICGDDEQHAEMQTQQNAITGATGAKDGADRLVVSGWIPVLAVHQGPKVETTTCNGKHATDTGKGNVTSYKRWRGSSHKCRRRGLLKRMGSRRLERRNHTRVERVDGTVAVETRRKHGGKKDGPGRKREKGGIHSGERQTSECNSGGDAQATSEETDDKDVVCVLVDTDHMDSNSNQNGSIDGWRCPETQRITVEDSTKCRTNDTPAGSETKAEKIDKSGVQRVMEEVESHMDHERSWATHEHPGRNAHGVPDKTQATTWAYRGWCTWRQAWTRVVLLIFNEWVTTWKKGHRDKGTNTSHKRTSDRWEQGDGTGTSEDHGKWYNITKGPTDTHERGVTQALCDTRTPKITDAETEHQHRALDVEAAKGTMAREDKSKDFTRPTRSTRDKPDTASEKLEAVKSEQCKVECDKDKTIDGESPMELSEAVKTQEGPCKHTSENGGDMDDTDEVYTYCNQMIGIDGRLGTEIQNSMVDIDCRTNGTSVVKVTKADKIDEWCAQCYMEKTERQCGYGCLGTKSACVCCDAKWLSQKTQATTWAFKWWRTWRRGWTKVVYVMFMNWKATRKKGNTDKGNTFSYNRTSDRWYHTVGTGTSVGNGNWHATRATGHTDTNKLGERRAHWETRVSRRNEAETEHQHWRLDTAAVKDTRTEGDKRKGLTRCIRNTRDKQDAAPTKVMRKEEQGTMGGGMDNSSDRDSPMEGEATETQGEESSKRVSGYDDGCNEQGTRLTWTQEDTDLEREQRAIRTRWTNTTREQTARLTLTQEDTDNWREQRAKRTRWTNTARHCHDRWKLLTCTNRVLRMLMHIWWAETTAHNPCISSETVECTCRLEREESSRLGELRDSEIAKGIAATRNRCPRVRYGQERWIWLVEKLPIKSCRMLERWYKGKRTDFLYITIMERLYRWGHRPH